jgi:hypothetical protein
VHLQVVLLQVAHNLRQTERQDNRHAGRQTSGRQNNSHMTRGFVHPSVQCHVQQSLRRAEAVVCAPSHVPHN